MRILSTGPRSLLSKSWPNVRRKLSTPLPPELESFFCGDVLRGHYDEKALSEEAGAWVPLIFKGETVGAALRTRSHVKPMIILLGHRISLATSLHYVLTCCKGYRLPEPTRLADKLSKD